MNLTCGRNPWKQASFEDSTYRAFTRSSDFLKTILPLSDELNDILGRVFSRSPEQRITLSELRNRILACPRFTVPVVSAPQALPSPVSAEPADYVYGDAPLSGFNFDAPLSPASSDSDDASTCSSDDGSLTSSASTIDDLDNDDFPQDDDMPTRISPEPQVYDHEASQVFAQDFAPQYRMPAVEQCQPCQASNPAPAQNCTQKFQLPYNIWGMLHKYAPPIHHHTTPFPQPMPLFANLQGCY